MPPRPTWTGSGRRSCAASTSNTPSACSSRPSAGPARRSAPRSRPTAGPGCILAAYTQLRLARAAGRRPAPPLGETRPARPAHPGPGPPRLSAPAREESPSQPVHQNPPDQDPAGHPDAPTRGPPRATTSTSSGRPPAQPTPRRRNRPTQDPGARVKRQARAKGGHRRYGRPAATRPPSGGRRRGARCP